LSCAFIKDCNPAVLAKDKSPSFIMSCFVSKSACVNPPPPPPPVEEIVLLVIVILSPAIKVFCFPFKAVSTYNFELYF
jgi:hypothetical protein